MISDHLDCNTLVLLLSLLAYVYACVLQEVTSSFRLFKFTRSDLQMIKYISIGTNYRDLKMDWEALLALKSCKLH